jgi:hypothetical protein
MTASTKQVDARGLAPALDLHKQIAAKVDPPPKLTELEIACARAIERCESPWQTLRAYKNRFVSGAMNRLFRKGCAVRDDDCDSGWSLTDLGRAALAQNGGA